MTQFFDKESDPQAGAAMRNYAVLAVAALLMLTTVAALAQDVAPVARNPYLAPQRAVLAVPPMERGAAFTPPPAAQASSAPAAPERQLKSLDLLLSQLVLVGTAGPTALVRQRVDATRVVTHSLREGRPWLVDGHVFTTEVLDGSALEVLLFEGKRLVGVIRPDAPQAMQVVGPQAGQGAFAPVGAGAGYQSAAPAGLAPAQSPRLMGSPAQGQR